MKIATVSIAKNEEKFVKPWVESAQGSDYLILLDTGSTDNTVELARSMGVIVHEKTYNPWRFDHARNDLLALIPDDVDYVINLDLDEVLVAGWREHMDNMDPNITAPRYKYVWNWQDDGSEGLVYHGYKIHKRHGYEWRHPVHEIMCPLIPEVQGWIGLEIHHHADPTKSRGQYLPLLKLSVEEDPEDDRNAYYYARELFFYGHTEESVAEFKRHLSLPRATWRPERAFSMRYLAKMIPEEREEWLLRACAEYHTGRETWVDLARHYFTVGNWEGCYYASKRALSITERIALYLTEAESWGWLPWDFAAISAYRLGKFEEAIELGRKALEFAPYDERLQKNMFWYSSATAKVNVIIPFKYHLPGLTRLLYDLSLDNDVNNVDKIVIVADGEEAYELLKKVQVSGDVIKTMVPLGSGIHHMWNLGMDIVGDNGHIAFINDDVELGQHCMRKLSDALSLDPTVGLVCPNYNKEPMMQDVIAHTTCRGRYDGTGGIAGFCFMLNKKFVSEWRFDESMKWWYGDDDIVNWVSRKKNSTCMIVAGATCKHAHSQTINNNPPENFAFIVAEDKKIFDAKWADIDQVYNDAMKRRNPSDIWEHLPTLASYASKSDTVTEMGTRFGSSTLALLRGKPDRVISYDLNAKFFDSHRKATENFAKLCEVDFQFIEADVLAIEIDTTDMLFIDTWHTYAQLTAELNRHAHKVNNWIILHDTETFGRNDEGQYVDAKVSNIVEQSDKAGLMTAVEDFLAANPQWKIKEHYTNNNGLTVLERKQ